MNRHVIRYYIAEGIRGVFLHGFSSFAAVGVIVACLIIMGSFSLVAVNIRTAISELEKNNEIMVTLDKDLSEADAKSLGSEISAIANVRDRIYVSPEEYRESLVKEMGEEYMIGIPPDVFSPQYRVALEDISFAAETELILQAIQGVDTVRSPSREMSALLSVRRVVELVSIILTALLMVVSLFIMANTIKLATFDRREEIGIQRMVGATKSFIRWPFIVEGFFLGIFASIAAYFLQWAAYERFSNDIGKLADSGVLNVLSFDELRLPMLAVFVLIGFLVGVGGSVMAIRKFLKT
ncbi:MAG: ABC transporter permease [Oscillospiraceae bacterium]|nr:ABC transporter permease [Oscillospiraceae bacterium]